LVDDEVRLGSFGKALSERVVPPRVCLQTGQIRPRLPQHSHNTATHCRHDASRNASRANLPLCPVNCRVIVSSCRKRHEKTLNARSDSPRQRYSQTHFYNSTISQHLFEILKHTSELYSQYLRLHQCRKRRIPSRYRTDETPSSTPMGSRQVSQAEARTL
jgi:hypothetical protein